MYELEISWGSGSSTISSWEYRPTKVCYGEDYSKCIKFDMDELRKHGFEIEDKGCHCDQMGCNCTAILRAPFKFSVEKYTYNEYFKIDRTYTIYAQRTNYS